MQYLKTFQIPSDGWANWYFSSWKIRYTPPPFDLPPGNFPEPSQGGYHNTWYPWNVFMGRFNDSTERTVAHIPCPVIHFPDITIFYGGNGSGKSTLLNVIAQKLGVQRQTLFNTSPFFDDYIAVCEA